MNRVVAVFKRLRTIIMSESCGQCRIARQDVPFGSIAATTFYGATHTITMECACSVVPDPPTFDLKHVNSAASVPVHGVNFGHRTLGKGTGAMIPIEFHSHRVDLEEDFLFRTGSATWIRPTNLFFLFFSSFLMFLSYSPTSWFKRDASPFHFYNFDSYILSS